MTPSTPTRPNIVLLIGEDTGRHIGCYGEPAATTPNLDRLASQGARFDCAFSHAPVCAPSRSGLSTGCYPTSYAAHHMRSTALQPPPMFTRWLKDAGYHVSWPSKTDFNFEMSDRDITDRNPWDQKLPGQPFFVFTNFFETHESSMWADQAERKERTNLLSPDEFHNPADTVVPPYLPDTPEVRTDIAHHYDHVTQIDHRIGDVLDHLERAGVADNTIVIFLADHGRGTPRGKRWLYDLGLHMPLIIRWPGHDGFTGGVVRKDMVAWVDIAPTLLAAAGVEAPDHLQGVSFLDEPSSREICFSHRGRMDEQFDCLISARDRRFRYIRNYRPDLPWSQRNLYMEQLTTMQQWRRMNADGKLTPAQSMWFSPTKPAEELYDCDADPWQMNNLAADPAHARTLNHLSAATDQWIKNYGTHMLVDERDLIKQGLEADRIEEFQSRVAPLPPDLQPAGGPWDMFGE